MTPLKVKLLTPHATPPERVEDGSVGYDLRACIPDKCVRIVHAGRRAWFETGVAVEVPPGTYGRIAPRSGLSLRKGIVILGGVIDPSYRGDVTIVLLNTGDEPFSVEHGDRIAQLVLERVEIPPVEVVDELSTSWRKAAGFGSTGVA